MSVMCKDGFQNDECRPLDELKIQVLKDGVVKQVPALHETWVEPRCFIYYTPPPPQMPDGSFAFGAKETWLDRMHHFCMDLKWLLHLKHYWFWSQMVYDRQAMEMVVSFLQESHPFYAIHEFPDDEDMWTVYQKAHHLVFLVINRLATVKESKTSYMSSKFLGELVYNNYIFTIPVLIDLCLLYGLENRAQLLLVVHTVFEIQPRYQGDLTKAVAFFGQALLNVGVRLDTRLCIEEQVPAKLTTRRNVPTLEMLHDLILHMLDTAVSLNSLLDVYSPACNTFHQQLFELRIVSSYENTIPELYQKLELLGNKENSQELYLKLKEKLNITRVELLQAFRYILSSCINNVIEKRESLSPLEIKNSVDDYVNVLTECLADKQFVRDYNRKFPLSLDLDMLVQLCPEMDIMKSGYLLEAAEMCFDGPGVLLPKKEETITEEVTPEVPPSPEINGLEESSNSNYKAKKQVVGVHLESLITQVKDILPHLGDGFVECCLEHYDYVSDAVLNAVLEDQLPPNLRAMDYTMPRMPPEEIDVIEDMDNLNKLEEEEEAETIDHSKSHRGKRKGPYRDMCQMLNDKSHRAEFRDLYTKLGIVDSVDTVYDDEYDDTYDHLDVSVEDEDLERRPFVVPRILRSKDETSSSEGEEETEGAKEEVGLQKDQFVPNPEDLRARAERRRLARQPPQQKNKDVVGRPKGQGQDKQIVVNRSNKTVHKAFHGNHNRRMGAQRKRQQGMLPS